MVTTSVIKRIWVRNMCFTGPRLSSKLSPIQDQCTNQASTFTCCIPEQGDSWIHLHIKEWGLKETAVSGQLKLSLSHMSHKCIMLFSSITTCQSSFFFPPGSRTPSFMLLITNFIIYVINNICPQIIQILSFTMRGNELRNKEMGKLTFIPLALASG